ncbi:histidine kinase [Bengtsoniella intestinalis]|uniref:sensor histidine kinase n=1 Tax=Bengtsoniella intestinalis TaxID=3073143 RepID=UPI00391FAF71
MEHATAVYNLIELMPQPAMIVDIRTEKIVLSNSISQSLFTIGAQTTAKDIANSMTHAPSAQTIHMAMRQELQTTGKSVLRHINMKTTTHEEEHYDIHISYVDETQTEVYMIFALSVHELQRMAQQNTYYDTISDAAYSYPFHLDVKTRRMEFFDPAMESEFHMSMVMENFPEPVFTYNYLCEDDKDDYIAVIERMYRGEPPEGSFRFYSLQGELLRYTANYVVNRDEVGNPVEVNGDFIIQSETKIDPEVSALDGVANGQKVVLAHQIKAHFFFNTLNTISALCKQDAIQADEAIRTFASYMRTYMHLINESDMIPFQQELMLVKSTLAIEKLRFPDSFIYELDLEETEFDIPPLTLQPMVENALLHGLRRTGHHGTLTITTCKRDGAIWITISDNGLGFDTSVLKKTKSIGLKNSTRRIQMMAGGSVDITSQLGAGTQAVIQIPITPPKEIGC